jgi:hypothetical protein
LKIAKASNFEASTTKGKSKSAFRRSAQKWLNNTMAVYAKTGLKWPKFEERSLTVSQPFMFMCFQVKQM